MVSGRESVEQNGGIAGEHDRSDLRPRGVLDGVKTVAAPAVAGFQQGGGIGGRFPEPPPRGIEQGKAGGALLFHRCPGSDQRENEIEPGAVGIAIPEQPCRKGMGGLHALTFV